MTRLLACLFTWAALLSIAPGLAVAKLEYRLFVPLVFDTPERGRDPDEKHFLAVEYGVDNVGDDAEFNDLTWHVVLPNGMQLDAQPNQTAYRAFCSTHIGCDYQLPDYEARKDIMPGARLLYIAVFGPAHWGDTFRLIARTSSKTLVNKTCRSMGDPWKDGYDCDQFVKDKKQTKKR